MSIDGYLGKCDVSLARSDGVRPTTNEWVACIAWGGILHLKWLACMGICVGKTNLKEGNVFLSYQVKNTVVGGRE